MSIEFEKKTSTLNTTVPLLGNTPNPITTNSFPTIFQSIKPIHPGPSNMHTHTH